MSAISNFLSFLRSAIYAIDVRDGIADAIEQCYNDVNNPTLKTEALEAALQTKIDEGEMAALTIGDHTITAAKLALGVIPTPDATLSQSGVPADAKKTGDELTAIKADLDAMEGLNTLEVMQEEFPVKATFTAGKLSPDGTINSSNTEYIVSGLITIPKGWQLTFKSNCGSDTKYWCCYDSSGQPLAASNNVASGRGAKNGVRIQAYSETKYVKISTRNTVAEEEINPVLSRIQDVEIKTGTIFDFFGCMATVGYGKGKFSTSGTQSQDNDYLYSSAFFLPKGASIEFDYALPSGYTGLFEVEAYYTFVQPLLNGDGKYHHAVYTADHDMFVRISTRATTGAVRVEESVFKDWTIRYRGFTIPYEKLYGKKIVVIGDSLVYGAELGNSGSWTQFLANMTGATVYNYGINGNAIADCGATGTPMSERYANISELSTADIIIVQGGANDWNRSCLIGTNDDTVNTTFKGAINVLIDGIRSINATAQLLFMTTYNRYGTTNTAGLKYIDYVTGMLEACANKAVPCFNNYADSGLTFLDANMKAWIDLGLYLGTTQNIHFSPAANKWLARKYKHFIEMQM